MTRRFHAALVLIFLALLHWGCGPGATGPEFEEFLIVSGYLMVGHGIDSLFVSRNISVYEIYTDEKAAVTADSVCIDTEGKSWRLEEYAGRKGVYHLPADSLIVTPGKTYGLRVYAGAHFVRASTLAPDSISIISLSTDTTTFPYPNPLLGQPVTISWTASDSAAGYDISVIARTHRQLVEIGFEDLIQQALAMNDFDTLGTFPPVRDIPVGLSTTSLTIFWDSFYYYGDYTIKVYAVDANFWELAASGVMYQGQSSEYDQPVYTMEGGYGIFAAVSVDSAHVHILKQ